MPFVVIPERAEARRLKHRKNYKKKIQQIHNGNIKLVGKYITNYVLTRHMCLVCSHEWKVRPYSIAQGHGCPKCGVEKAANVKYKGHLYDDRLKARHNGTIKRLGPYTNVRDKTLHKCLVCDYEWSPTPDNLLRVSGCPVCNRPKGHSKIALSWLESVAKQNKIFIQHTGNKGEYILPDVGLRVDGYCHKTRTVYEFYGDVAHGNPKLFKPKERCSWYDRSKTAQQLFLNTVAREQQIKAAGYNLVTMWEYDYRKSIRK